MEDEVGEFELGEGSEEFLISKNGETEFIFCLFILQLKSKEQLCTAEYKNEYPTV